MIITPYIIPKSKDLTYVREQLSELKVLEDRYLKNSLIRLKQKQIKAQQEKTNYDMKLHDLDEKLNKSKNSKTKKDDELSIQEKHRKILGM